MNIDEKKRLAEKDLNLILRDIEWMTGLHLNYLAINWIKAVNANDLEAPIINKSDIDSEPSGT